MLILCTAWWSQIGIARKSLNSSSFSFSLIDLSFISSELKEKLNKDIDVISSGGLDEHFLNRIKKDEICIYENK